MNRKFSIVKYAIIICSIVFLTYCSKPADTMNNNSIPVLPVEQNLIDVSENNTADDTPIDLGRGSDITLVYKLVKEEPSFTALDKNDIQEITKEIMIDSGKVMIYTKPQDKESLYAAYESEKGLFDLGMFGSSSPSENIISSPEISLLDMYNKSLIRIKGVYGANAPTQLYFYVSDLIPAPTIRIETGNTEEIDLDGDDVKEIVSSHGTPTHTIVYKRNDKHFGSADLNEALNATSVHWDHKNKLFVAYYQDTNHTEYFIYTGKELSPYNFPPSP
jgi:hypothetical protein